MKKVFTYSLREELGNRIKDESYSRRKSCSQMVEEILDSYFDHSLLSESDPVILQVSSPIKTDVGKVIKKFEKATSVSKDKKEKPHPIIKGVMVPEQKDELTILKEGYPKEKSIWDQVDEIRNVDK